MRISTPLVKFKEILWGKTPENKLEARLLMKIDWFVLSFSCLLYWVNYVDRLNLSNAYVSGMKEDLNMMGNEFNIINTCFTVGYVIALVPNNLILLRIRPSYWMSFTAMAWGLLTLGVYKCTSWKQICALKFFQAVFESATFSGVHLILGSWYKEDELTKRSAVFTSSGLLGGLFSGVMQSAIYTNMDDYNGIAGWRWLFIIDFIITVPVSIYGLLFFPDTPQDSKAFYFTKEEKDLAISRLKPTPKTRLDFSVFKRVLGRWHFWLFSLLFALGGENESFPINSCFALWLQYFGYSVPQRNHYPMGVAAMGVLGTFGAALYVDATGAKYHYRVAFFITISVVVSAILFLARPDSPNFVFASQYLSGFSYAGQASFFAWANVVCANDLQERSITLASMNMFSNAVNAWWSIIFYSADLAPQYTRGCWAIIATGIASSIVAAGIRFLQLKERTIFDSYPTCESENIACDQSSSQHNEAHKEKDFVDVSIVQKDSSLV